jgi:hypothetical protein
VQVSDQGEDKPIGQIRRQIHVLDLNRFTSILLNTHLLRDCIDGSVVGVRKRRTFLYMAIAEEAKTPTLQVGGGLIINRAVFETEYQS